LHPSTASWLIKMNLLEIRQLFSSSLEPSSEINLVKITLESHLHEIPQKTVTSESPSKQMLQNSHIRITLKTKAAKHNHVRITFKTTATKHNHSRNHLQKCYKTQLGERSIE
jgi:hypothetical protein